MTALPLNDLVRHQLPLRNELENAVLRVIARGRYVLDEEGELFEREFASYCGIKHVIGVANGSDAIEIALRAAGIQPGDTVITAANAGFYATSSILAIGAQPAFADVDLVTNVIIKQTLSDALDQYPFAKAVVVTHLYGLLADVDKLAAMCSAAKVLLIEDCAQAHGARRNGRHAGSFGLAGCFSFYPSKNLGAIGDAGAIVTQDDSLARTFRSLRQYGWGDKYKVVRAGGRNSRLDEIEAAVLSTKLPRLDQWNTRRRAIAKRYSGSIVHPRVFCPPISGDDYVAHLYVLRCTDRDGLRSHLHSRAVSTGIHYPVPDHKQIALQQRESWPSLPITERLSSEILTLPCFPELTDAEIDHVVTSVNDW